MRPAASCKRGDVIEVQGPAASGKSHLFYYLLASCVLPASYSSVNLSGWGKAAVLLDADHKFDVKRFSQLLRSRVGRLSLNSATVEAIATKALGLLHVFQPTSSHQLVATIQHLPMYLATNLPEVDLGLVAVDSITAFYWPDRYLQEQTRSCNHSRPQSPLNDVLAALHSLAQSRGPLILLSSWDLSPSSAAQDRWRLDPSTAASRPDTDKPGQQLLPISHRITVISSNLTSTDGEIAADRRSTIPLADASTCLFSTVRSPGSMRVTQFKLHITEDDIAVC
jgi:DNA-repair protein XRCC2